MILRCTLRKANLYSMLTNCVQIPIVRYAKHSGIVKSWIIFRIHIREPLYRIITVPEIKTSTRLIRTTMRFRQTRCAGLCTIILRETRVSWAFEGTKCSTCWTIVRLGGELGIIKVGSVLFCCAVLFCLGTTIRVEFSERRFVWVVKHTPLSSESYILIENSDVDALKLPKQNSTIGK